MLSDLIMYYEDSGHPVLPFLIAPVLEQQDTLIMGPRNVASQHDSFLDECFRRLPSNLYGGLYCRGFMYGSKVVITIVLPTDFKEEASQRSGLVLTLGALLERRIFKEYHLPSSRYFHRFIHCVNSYFGVDLFENGATEIVKQLNNEANHNELKSKFFAILNVLLISGSKLRPRKLWQRLNPTRVMARDILELHRVSRTSRRKGLPKFILCNCLDPKSITQLFLGEIDRYFQSGHVKSFDVASQNSPGGKSIEFIALEWPPFDAVTALDMVRSHHQKFVRLY